MTRPPVERIEIPGPAGAIEVTIDAPNEVRGIALVGHPHPLFGGTKDNKVVFTLARTFRDLHYVALRPNFRGVGATEGEHDEGEGETDDMHAVLDYARARWGGLHFVLAGFSFGSNVQARLAKRMREAGAPAQRLVMIGTAAGTVPDMRHYDTPPVPADTIVIHGEADETVPLANVLDWARPQQLPVIVVPGADHFFHSRLHLIRDIIVRAWRH